MKKTLMAILLFSMAHLCAFGQQTGIPEPVRSAVSSPEDTGVRTRIAAAKEVKENVGREKIYRELGGASNAEAVTFLSKTAVTEPEPGGRISALSALKKTGGPAALKGILAALAVEKHKGVRIHAVNALGFFSEPESLVKLRSVAGSDADKDLRTAAYMALARLGDAETLVKSFEVETDTGARLGILDALGRTDEGESRLRGIKEHSGDKDVKARIELHTKRK